MIWTFLHLVLQAYEDTACMAVGPATSLRHAYTVAQGLNKTLSTQPSKAQMQTRPPSLHYTPRHPYSFTAPSISSTTCLSSFSPPTLPLLLSSSSSKCASLSVLASVNRNFAVPIRRLGHRVRDVPVLGDKVRDGAVRDEHDVGVGAREGEDIVAEGGGARGEGGTRVGVFAGLLGVGD
jgi:hypothetical protein